MIEKPFKGPTPLGPDDSIYGRQDDIDALVDILLSDRIILLCSASGAGKTSLLQAGLNKTNQAARHQDRQEYSRAVKRLGCMARMRLRDFQVLPTIRVDTPLPESTIGSKTANRFTFSMLNHLEQVCPEESIPPEDLAAIDLNFYFEQRAFLQNPDEPKLMVFDQFEELMHKDPLDVESKEVFLSQLGRVLDNPLYWAIFAMRSEYITDFDEYLDLIPTGLSSRFTLQLLSQQGAYDAITKPLLETGRSNQISIDEKAAYKLVMDLSGNKGSNIKSQAELSANPAIEPLHLQVVCDSLWSHATKTDQHISESTIARSGGVNKALENYAAEQLRQFSQQIASEKPGETLSARHAERTIRKWVETTLISSQKTRNSIYEDDERVKMLGHDFHRDDVLPVLCNTYLIRRDVRNKRNLYEISHDRLVEIIIENNHHWFDKNLNAIQRLADKWNEDQKPELLLTDVELKAAQKWLRRQPAQETAIESKYIKACTSLHEKIKKEKKIKIISLVAVGVVILTTTTFAIFFKLQNKKIKLQQIILSDQAQGLLAQRNALAVREKALEIQVEKFFEASRVAEKKSDQNRLLLMASSRLKAWISGDLGVADLVTLQTYKTYQNYKLRYDWQDNKIEKEIASAIDRSIFFSFRAARMSPYVRQIIFAPSTENSHPKTGETPVVSAHPVSNRIAVVEGQTAIKIYAYGHTGIDVDRQIPLSTSGQPILNVAFQPGWAHLVVFSPSEIRLVDQATAGLIKSIPDIELSRHRPCFDSEGRFLAAASADGRIWLWETTHWSRRELKGADAPSSSLKSSRIFITFSQDAELIAVGDSTGSIHVWRTVNAEHVFWKNRPAVRKSGDGQDHGSRIVAIGFTPDAKGVVTVSQALDGIHYWSFSNIAVNPVKLLLNPNVIERANRFISFSQMAKTVDPADSKAQSNTGSQSKARKPIEQHKVVAGAFDNQSPMLHFTVSLNNGYGFILRSPNAESIESSSSASVKMDTDFFRFPKSVTQMAFVYPDNAKSKYNFDRIVGITPKGDVFMVDDIPKQDRLKMANKADIDTNIIDPDAFEKYICSKVWRNLTQEEWDTFVPDEPYQCTCPQFGPGFGTLTTECPSWLE